MANLKNYKVSKVSYDTIRETTSGLKLSTMSVENKTTTATQAPYLIRVISDGDWDIEKQCEEYVKSCEGDCTFEQARYYWKTLMERVAEALTSGGYTSVDFGYWRFELAVAGSVPTANSALTAENYVYIAVYPSDELQKVAASIDTAESIVGQAFEILEVYGHDHVRSVFTAGQDALITGKRFTMGGTGEKVELIIGTSVYTCENKTGANDLNTRIRVKVPYVTAGSKKATLRITAFGQGRTALSTIEKENIEVVFVEPTPSLTKIQQGNRAAGTAGFGQGAENAITLTGVIPGGKQASDKLTLHLLAEDGSTVTEMDATGYVTASDETTLTLGNGIENDSTKSDGDWQNKSAKFVLARDGKDYPLTFKFMNA